LTADFLQNRQPNSSQKAAWEELAGIRFADYLSVFCHSSAKLETGPACAANARLRWLSVTV
jgi:hypothetical protein